ncbi:MAG: isocitrate lyase/PEP mutase family protein [Bacillota bacterium]
MEQRKNLKKYIETGEILVAPGAHDVLTAKIIEKVGFNAVYMTGYGQSASHLGKPDVGLLTMSEMVDRASNYVEAVDLPIIADADTGFGNVINIQRTIKCYEKAGVSAIQLEDQVMPKKCGHMTGRQLVPKEEMVAKVRSAIDARNDENMLIIARTDARTTMGIEKAIERGQAYAEAGADIIFIESPENKGEMELINKEIDALTLANMVEGGRTPLLPKDELEELNYDLVIYPTASVYTATKAMLELMKSIKNNNTTENYMSEMVTFNKFNEVMGLSQIKDLENKFYD